MGALERASRDLATLDRAWALVGGLAVSVRTEPRFTRDADLAVVVRDDADAEILIGQLLALGYRLVFTVEQDAAVRLATVRLAPPATSEKGIVLDLLFASSGIEPELVAAAEVLELWPGLQVRVPRVGHLLGDWAAIMGA